MIVLSRSKLSMGYGKVSGNNSHMKKELQANLGLVNVFSEIESEKMKGLTFQNSLFFKGNTLVFPEGGVHSDYLPSGSVEYCLDFSGVGYLALRLKNGIVLQNLDITECPVPDQWLNDWKSEIDLSQSRSQKERDRYEREQWHKQQDEKITKERAVRDKQAKEWEKIARQMIEWAKSRPPNHVLYRHKWFKKIVSLDLGAVPTELHPSLTRFGKYPKHIDVHQDALTVFKQYGFKERTKPLLKDLNRN